VSNSSTDQGGVKRRFAMGLFWSFVLQPRHGARGSMTDEQKSRFAALQGAWLAVREKRRRAETATELDAAITEFLKLHRAETDTVVLEAFRHWQVLGAAETT